ncbi:hypothetical protein ACFL5O_09905, partial [Myxococcota bacterium]
MPNLLPIDRFFRLARLTIKALRLYDEQGVLRPAYVESDTGYSLSHGPPCQARSWSRGRHGKSRAAIDRTVTL